MSPAAVETLNVSTEVPAAESLFGE